MGKIRVKTLGDEEAEKNQKNKAKRRKETKKLVKGAHGGERVVSVGPSEEELAALENEPQETKGTEEIKEIKKKEVKKQVKSTKPTRSQNYQTVAKLVDKNKQYALAQALSILPKLQRAKFDETVELHINTTEAGIAGTVTLPHGTGKKIRVAIADPTTASGQAAADELLKKIESGTIDFDILLATPDMMPNLSKVARFLGPKGLMPNPKNGTITKNPQEAAKKYEAGLLSFKTESKIPVMHLTVGKVSFGEKKLAENITTAFSAIQAARIKKVVLKSTMSPGIKLSVA